MVKPFPDLYENIVDKKLSKAMEQRSADPEDSFSALAEHMKQIPVSALEQLPPGTASTFKPRYATSWSENWSTAFRTWTQPSLHSLLALQKGSGPKKLLPRPDIPLSEPCLLTGTRHDPIPAGPPAQNTPAGSVKT